jgi:ATP-dependent DNA helicase RecG
MLSFSTPVAKIPSAGKTNCIKLKDVGIYTVGDLLYYFPFRYEDYSTCKNITDLQIGETVTIRGQITKIKTSRTWRKRMQITEAYINDGTGNIKVVWFNFPMIIKILAIGKYVQVSGKITLRGSEAILQHPNIEPLTPGGLTRINQAKNSFPSKEQSLPYIPEKAAGNTSHTSTGILAPIYSETKNITSFWLRKIIKIILEQVSFEEIIPHDILSRQKLLPLKDALQSIHFPSSLKTAAAAKNRFAFEKMFLMQLKSLQIKNNWEKQTAQPIPFDQKFIKNFVTSLPFSLTGAQKKSAWQIIRDLEKNTPMNRLLEGDVGSGKTVVAAMAILSVVNRNHQAALLAPTEVLASQHYFSLRKLFQKIPFNSALLTSSISLFNGEKITKKNLLEKIKTNEIHYVIGTHALLSDKITFKTLALIIIDEQHRFGVNQRAHLQQQAGTIKDGKKTLIPHLLTMTATPIPRTLSLALFGNLALSIIDEYPKDRKKVITKIILPRKREEIYEFVKSQLKEGRQAFIICPLVEESTKQTELKSATKEHQRLQEEVFTQYKLGLLHGKMKSKEKDAVMQQFKNKTFDILVSTSVVEVGVDVPNATIIIIEGAERFGLSQLHQFRGRVGRGNHQSYCFLFTSENAPNTTARLKVMEATNNGFRIAQEDLRLRGPGQFLGTSQSGEPDIAMESLSDIRLIQEARLEAQRLLSSDPLLNNFPLLKKTITKLESTVHWE